MSDQPQSNALFLKKSFDEFTNKTTITHISKVKYETGGNAPVTFLFQLWQFKRKEGDSLLIDCLVTKKSKTFLDRFQASKGKIIFNCDQDVFELEYDESKTSKDERTRDEETYYYYSEYGFYGLVPIQLKQICDAKILKIRISGKDSRAEPGEKFCTEFQKHCRQFYSNAYDASLYPESLVVDVPKQKSGCFVATAAMGSYEDPAVQALTQFRDAILLRSILGRQVVHSYYAVSPSIASWMRGKVWVCRFAKWFLVLPISKIVENLRLERFLKK